jgi:hypothetical protein
MTDDTTNYLNSPLPGCAPQASPEGPLSDLIGLLEMELDGGTLTEDTNAGGFYMTREVMNVLRRGQAGERAQLARAARMIRALAELWGFRRGGSLSDTAFMTLGGFSLAADAGWSLTEKGTEALTRAEKAKLTAAAEEDFLSDAGEGC